MDNVELVFTDDTGTEHRFDAVAVAKLIEFTGHKTGVTLTRVEGIKTRKGDK